MWPLKKKKKKTDSSGFGRHYTIEHDTSPLSKYHLPEYDTVRCGFPKGSSGVSKAMDEERNRMLKRMREEEERRIMESVRVGEKDRVEGKPSVPYFEVLTKDDIEWLIDIVKISYPSGSEPGFVLEMVRRLNHTILSKVSDFEVKDSSFYTTVSCKIEGVVSEAGAWNYKNTSEKAEKKAEEKTAFMRWLEKS